jgi:hypothetical protein
MTLPPAAADAASTQSFAVNNPPPPITQKVEQNSKPTNLLAATGGPATSPNPEPTLTSLASTTGGKGVNLTV